MPARKNLHKVKPKRHVLVDNWRCGWRWLSVQVNLVIAASSGLILFVPTVKDYLPDEWTHAIMGALAVAAIFGRIINQESKQ